METAYLKKTLEAVFTGNNLIKEPDMRSLKLAVVTETWTPDINGVAHSIGRIVSYLLELGVQVDLYYINDQDDNEFETHATLHQQDEKPKKQINYFPMTGFRLPFYNEVKIGFPCTQLLVQRWQDSPPDVVQIVTEGGLGYSAMRAAKKLGIPAVSDYHTNFQLYSKSYHLGWLEKLVFSYLRRLHNRTDSTLVPTKQLQAELLHLGFENVMLMKRGIDTQVFNSRHRSSRLRQSWGANENTLVILYVGRIAPEKNLGLAVEAYQEMKKVTDTKFVLVGDGPLRKKLEETNPEFIFCGMQIGDDLSQHYASGDIFLSPSITETFGNTVLEAMASGLAVVSFDYAASREHIEHNVSGKSVPFNEPDLFIQQAVSLIEDRDLVTLLQKNAPLSVEGNSWKDVSQDLLVLFQNLIKRVNYDEYNPTNEPA